MSEIENNHRKVGKEENAQGNAPPYAIDEKTDVKNGTMTPVSLEAGSAGERLEGPTYDSERTGSLLRKLDWNIVPFLSLLYLYVPGVANLTMLRANIIALGSLSSTERTSAMLVLWGWRRILEWRDWITMYANRSVWACVWQLLTCADCIGRILPVVRCCGSPQQFDDEAHIALSLALHYYGRLGCLYVFPHFPLCSALSLTQLGMTLMGLVTNYTGLLVVRCALGLAEGGLFPGVTFYITLWYRRHECGLRMAIFFSAATLAGAFGGLLARGISEMDGIGGRPGWAWIFIIEGLITVVVAAFAKWAINDYPATAKFLNTDERREVTARLKLDRSHLDDSYHIKYFYDALKDWKIYVHMFITIGIYTPLYSISLFLPTIVKNMGYTSNESQLMTVPPYVYACICTIGAGYYADRLGSRGPFMMLFCLSAMVGFAMLLGSDLPGVQYAGTFLATGGIYPNVPMGVAWNGNNIGGSTKRAVGIAMHVGFGNLGGAIAGFAYRSTDAPRYFQGHGLLLATTTMAFFLSGFMTMWLKRENQRRDQLMAEQGMTLDDYTDDQKEAERERGDDATVSFAIRRLVRVGADYRDAVLQIYHLDFKNTFGMAFFCVLLHFFDEWRGGNKHLAAEERARLDSQLLCRSFACVIRQ